MGTLSKNEPLGTLGLPLGDHWVKFHVEEETITFEVAASSPDRPSARSSEAPASRGAASRSFVEKWSGKGRVLPDAEMADDARLSELTAKHLR